MLKFNLPHRYSVALLPIAFLLLLTACSKDDEPTVAFQEPDLKTYIDRFVAEAAQRGEDIDLSQLEAVFVPSIERNGRTFCGWGYSNYQGTGQPRIEIVNSGFCWNDRTDLEKENLFFHEIGHAILRRPHINIRLDNTLPKSMMCDQCDQFRLYTDFSLHRRDYYINELLNPSAAVPEWGERKTNFNLVWEDGISSDTDWGFGTASDFVTGSVDDSGQINGEFALKITSTQRDTQHFGAWGLGIDDLDIPQGATVRLEVTLKTGEPMLGDGAAVAIRTDANSRSVDFFTTQGRQFYTGSLANQVVTVTLPDYSASVELINIFLIYLTNTTGEVFFDDIKLYVAED